MEQFARKSGILGVILVLICGCTQVRMISKFNSGRPVLGEEPSMVPFDLREHAISVRVKVNDNPKEYDFVLDTGALTMIDEKIAKELNLERGAEMPTPDKTKKVYLTKGKVAISLGGARVEDFIVPIFDITSSVGSAAAIDGFIGSDFLRFFKVTIDYSKKTLFLSLNTDSSEPAHGAYTMKIDKPFPLRFPVVKCTIDGDVVAKGMIDTGCSYGLVIPLSFVERLPERSRRQLIRSKGLIAEWPFTKADHNYLTRIESLNVGTMEVRNIPAIFAELPSNRPDLLLGKDFLSQFLVTINYPKNEMTLVSHETIRFKENIFSTGLALEEHEHGRIVVKGLWEGSPADRDGIQPGDEILKVGSKSVRDVGYTEIKKILRDETVEDIELLVRTRDGENSVVLRKEMLLPDVMEE